MKRDLLRRAVRGPLGLALVLAAAPLSAQNTVWTGAVDTNFFNDANWTLTAPNNTNELGIIDSTDPNQVAIIAAGTGNVVMDGMDIGFINGGGKVIQNGGVLVFDAFSTTKIGGDGALPSTWIMNGNAQLLYDGPLAGGGTGYGSDGLNGTDFDVGNGASVATFELHDSAILRIADDMKISDNGTAAGGHVVLDGNAQITAGSGTSIGARGPGSLTIGGNALYVSGNSAGPGNTAEGFTNEGYLTLHESDIVVKQSGRLWLRSLQVRDRETNVTIQDNARFDVFDVFFFDSPELGVSTVKGDVLGNERTSEIAENPSSVVVFTIKNSGVMTVDSQVGGAEWTGLAMSGGTNRGASGTGGKSLVEVQDNGTFAVHQDLNMTLGTDPGAASTLKVRGPAANVSIGGDLRMALDSFDTPNPGSATLHAVITAATHATIDIGGAINIDGGNLVIELDGYSPLGGESYELISAGSVTGAAFKSVDLSLAPLAEPLSWELVTSGTSVLLNVLGSIRTPGDFNGDGAVDGSDLLVWQRGFGAQYDAGDLADWEANFGAAAAATAGVPEPTAWALALLGASAWMRRRRV